MRFGVDLSSNNPHPLAAASLFKYLSELGGGAQPFAIVKVNQGTGYVNPDFAGDLATLRGAGFALAGYLMDEGTADVVAEEATYRRVAGVLPQADDDELPDGLSPQAYAAHCAALNAQNQGAPDYLNQSEVASGMPIDPGGLWLAQYNGAPGTVKYPCLIHQYTSSGSIPGVPGEWDLNVWMGSEQQFGAFFGIGPPDPGPIAFSWFAKALSGRYGVLNAPVVANVPTASGAGYTLVAADGGTFNYGDAPMLGSLAGHKLNAPIVDAVRTSSGQGLVLVGTDGGVFCLGDAKFEGSEGGKALAAPVISVKLTPSGAGYWLTGADGGVFAFGDAKFLGAPTS